MLHRRRARATSATAWRAATTSQPTIFEGTQQDAHLPGGDLRPGGRRWPRFDDFDGRASRIANDTLYGLGAGVWTARRSSTAYRPGRNIQAGRVWTNCYHCYPAHAAFGGYKQSGIGRETHRMMLDHYQQTKNLLVSYDPQAAGASSDDRGPHASSADPGALGGCSRALRAGSTAR